MILVRIPPRLMLLSVLGLALMTTWLVTREMDKHQQEMRQRIAELQRQSQQPPKVVYVDKPEKPVESSPEFQAVLKPGYRAVSVPVDISNGSTRFMTPGSHVDIMAITGSGTDIDATAILSDVEVVAVGNAFQKSSAHGTSEPANSVTVSLMPKDAAKLLKAQVAGKLCLTLRSDRDHTPLAVSDLVKTEPPPARVKIPAPPPVAIAPQIRQIEPVKAQPAGPQVELWAGSRKDVVSFKKESP